MRMPAAGAAHALRRLILRQRLYGVLIRGRVLDKSDAPAGSAFSYAGSLRSLGSNELSAFGIPR